MELKAVFRTAAGVNIAVMVSGEESSSRPSHRRYL
jgi:hypothetical protein